MKSETKLFAAALCLCAASIVHAGTTVWGEITFTDGSTQSVSNTVGNAASLAAGDLLPNTAGAKPKKLALKSSLDGSGELLVNGISLAAANDLEIVADGVSLLRTVGSNSVFTVTQSGAFTVTYSKLAFKGDSASVNDFAPMDGGAIYQVGGKMVVSGCAFTNMLAHFSGGAVSAVGLVGDSSVTNCSFSGNNAHPINGYGGAIYASKARGAGAATLYVVDSDFFANSAENGGAICTLTVVNDDETAIDLDVSGAEFDGNGAFYEGGAVMAEGGVNATNAAFSANSAGLVGGAICVTGVQGNSDPSAVKILDSEFLENVASNNTSSCKWSAGGAVAVMKPGSSLTLDEYVLFTSNSAISAGHAYGGAVYTDVYVTNDFSRSMFVGNAAKAGTKNCYGDAVSVTTGRTSVATCVFDCGTNPNSHSFGNAIDFDGADGSLLNSTFRRGTVEAVSTYNGTLAVTNCVIVGNGSSGDLYLDGTAPVAMAYTAYGKMLISDAANLVGSNNLSNRNASLVYAGDSLRLAGDGLNLVAGLGLKQTASDYDKVSYGSMKRGYSMGAYETNMTAIAVQLDGSKEYDTNTSSNGCSWTWSCWTNVSDGVYAEADWPATDFGELDAAFNVTNWTFSSAVVGYYASTNTSSRKIDGGVEPATTNVAWLTDSKLVDFIYTGTITTNDDEVYVIVIPDEFAWDNGNEIKPVPSVSVSNTVTHEMVPVAENEYKIEYSDNVDPTGSATVTVTGTNNYSFSESTTFFITAYLTQYYTDDVLTSISTNGLLSSNNVVAVMSVPADCCLDYQNSVTNGMTYRFGQGGDGQPDVTTLTVRYAADKNGDGIPDKYQKRIILATVNGEWSNSSNAYDRVTWATMTNNVGLTYTNADGSVEGLWVKKGDASGVCDIDPSWLTDAGGNMLYGFVDGKWYDVNGNSATESAPISWNSFPIFVYVYEQRDGKDRGDKKAFTVSSLQTLAGVTGLSMEVSLTDFDFADGDMAGAIKAQIVRVADNAVLGGVDLDTAKIEVLGAATLDGDWSVIGEATTDENGVWTLARVRTDRSHSATRTMSADRTGTWDISGDDEPKFFQVRLITE